MQAIIQAKEVSLKFRLYHSRNRTMKEAFSDFFLKRQVEPYSDFYALNDINFTINHGDRVGIVGHNGAGKSTLLKAICGIYPPTSGQLVVRGKVSPLLDIGAGFNVELSGRDNIHLNGAILGYPKEKLKDIEREVIAYTGLEEFIDTAVKYYSTGMYMKLAFAVATALPPDILILDELFAGGDAAFIDKALERMNKFINQSSIMVFVSHQPHLLLELCNRIIWMEKGKIIDDGVPAVVMQRYLEKMKG